jgi:hypothetical protein
MKTAGCSVMGRLMIVYFRKNMPARLRYDVRTDSSR